MVISLSLSWMIQLHCLGARHTTIVAPRPCTQQPSARCRERYWKGCTEPSCLGRQYTLKMTKGTWVAAIKAGRENIPWEYDGPGYLGYGESWNTQQMFGLSPHWEVLQPLLSMHKPKAGAGREQRTTYCRRPGLRPHKEPGRIEAHRTLWDASEEPEGSGRWSC